MTEKMLLYKRKIIRQLFFTEALSCTALSSRVHKSIPLITTVLADLIATGEVMEIGQAPSTGGRRPVMYSLAPNVFYVVCVAMDQFTTRIAVMDVQTKMLHNLEQFELPLQQNSNALSALTKKIKEVIKKSNIPKEKLIGIGIGMPGFIDVQKGVNYTFLPVPEGSITAYIQQETSLSAFIDNDSSLIALAELRFGAASRTKNTMVINLGWGVGLGMILNGELFRGHNGFAGEFSHIPIFSNGKLCSCGKTGCLETETSLLVLIEKAKNGLNAGRQSALKSHQLEHYEQAVEAIVEAVKHGDQFVVELFSEAGYNIGRGIAILIHLMNPEVVILSGRGSKAGRVWFAPIQQALNEHSIPRLAASTLLEQSALGYEAELIGAAALVMEYFDSDMKSHVRPKESTVSLN
jgi:predicted NBD/HSP70 family sugar kinase